MEAIVALGSVDWDTHGVLESIASIDVGTAYVGFWHVFLYLCCMFGIA